MKTISEYIKESEETVYAVIDNDLDGAIMSVWNTKEEADSERDARLGENSELKLSVKKVKKSEIEKENKE